MQNHSSWWQNSNTPAHAAAANAADAAATTARRYLVVLRWGGVYADADVECRRPLDPLLLSKDTLVAGWDGDFGDARAAVEAG